MIFDEFLKSISKIENIPLPAEASQFKMVPPYRLELVKRQKEAMKNAKSAGVLALFYPSEENLTKLALILRKTYNGVHSAQVGFPGGKLEDHDNSLLDAAIRETNEEIGVSKNHIEIVKKLTQVYIPPSNFNVQPFMAVTKETPKFIKEESEVETIIQVELTHFLDENVITSKKVKTSYNVEVEVPAFKLNNYVVWGATAMMLSEIKDILKQLL
ncbi:NUDIX hydrolase [Seonamhaeicola aphaedonensis]|uniref:NUDIX domain-containing protein n=1 Tax=Seonamhaeicola aphaedonensis TaxID=1461338 RepID=A0A3D9HD71_9FLAO|nr:CoA pyrophosphatase [Seonamhaeicola aphaedonensis]RED47432.1 NUDIX domain-containing protein [Seonamhaeicola aphaedonensis]